MRSVALALLALCLAVPATAQAYPDDDQEEMKLEAWRAARSWYRARRRLDCRDCRGEGIVDCGTCGGRGIITVARSGGGYYQQDCPHCEGGRVDCPDCVQGLRTSELEEVLWEHWPRSVRDRLTAAYGGASQFASAAWEAQGVHPEIIHVIDDEGRVDVEACIDLAALAMWEVRRFSCDRDDDVAVRGTKARVVTETVRPDRSRLQEITYWILEDGEWGLEGLDTTGSDPEEW